jgi:hypothetical protein
VGKRVSAAAATSESLAKNGAGAAGWRASAQRGREGRKTYLLVLKASWRVVVGLFGEAEEGGGGGV